MRFPYSGVLGSLFVISACATGENLDKQHVALIDAGLVQPPDESGGQGGGIGEGGAETGGDVSGGAPASGGVIGSGGSGSGGKASGGMPGTGGKASGGAASGGASSGGTGSGGKGMGGASSGGATPEDGGNCMTGEKFCGGLCTPPAPRVGCGLTGCTACTLTAPANGYITCLNNACAFDCLSGYMKMGSMCTGMGAGGGGGSCKPSSCSPTLCNVISGPACCTSAGKCGCPAIPYVAQTCAVP